MPTLTLAKLTTNRFAVQSEGPPTDPLAGNLTLAISLEPDPNAPNPNPRQLIITADGAPTGPGPVAERVFPLVKAGNATLAVIITWDGTAATLKVGGQLPSKPPDPLTDAAVQFVDGGAGERRLRVKLPGITATATTLFGGRVSVSVSDPPAVAPEAGLWLEFAAEAAGRARSSKPPA